MPSPEPLITLRLTLSTSATIEPDEITRRVGLTPSSTWRVRDPVGRVTGRPDQRVFKDTGWQLAIGPQRTIDMPSVLAELVSLVAPRLDAIEATVAELALAVDVGLHVKMVDQAPIGTIDRQTLALLARLHAELDLDLYVVDADYDEPPGQRPTA